MNRLLRLLLTATILLPVSTSLYAQQSTKKDSVIRQKMSDAWYTGPLLAPSAATLPKGHFLAEPYLFDVISPHVNEFGSLTYLLYGLANRFTVGLIPTAFFNEVSNGPSSSGVGFGDLTVLAQYRLHLFHEGNWLPTASINVQQSFPTGKYDQLGTRLSDGFGSGAYTTILSLYFQTSVWLANGRILRMRFNFSKAFSSRVNVRDASVYGTETGFEGYARPGSPFSEDVSFEYSLSRSWVLALDATFRHNSNTSVDGLDTNIPDSQILLNSGFSQALGFAPAIEYSWKPNIGVIFGTRIIPVGHNSAASVTPAIAVNIVY